MKKVVLILASICLLASCEKFVDEEDGNVPSEKVDEVYELIDIKYFLLGDDIDPMREETILLNSQKITNNSPFAINFSFVLQKNQKLESHFIPNTPTLFKIKLDENQNEEVPSFIRNDTIYTNFSHWKYLENVNVLFPLNNENTQTFACTPYSTITVDDYVIINRLTTGYRAIFEWKQAGKQQVVEGKWMGTQIVGSKIDVQVDEIKN